MKPGFDVHQLRYWRPGDANGNGPGLQGDDDMGLVDPLVIPYIAILGDIAILIGYIAIYS